eukprot:scaffold5152_cov60-Attheya_sp.AAC.3
MPLSYQMACFPGIPCGAIYRCAATIISSGGDNKYSYENPPVAPSAPAEPEISFSPATTTAYAQPQQDDFTSGFGAFNIESASESHDG